MKRVNIQNIQPAAYTAMFGLEKYLGATGLPPRLMELLRTRASQINGCAFCIDMHGAAARNQGETVERLMALAAWRESPLFEESERAALALVDEVTRIADGGVSDETYADLARHFDETRIAQMIMLVAVINSWNRIAVSTRVQ